LIEFVVLFHRHRFQLREYVLIYHIDFLHVGWQHRHDSLLKWWDDTCVFVVDTNVLILNLTDCKLRAQLVPFLINRWKSFTDEVTAFAWPTRRYRF
jgi:hypothetical protein